METSVLLAPFPNCPALDGCHCVTNSLQKIFHAYGHPLSEEMLLGLGAGMGFIYWQMKIPGQTQDTIFVGGRGNMKDFYSDLESRTGVRIREITTASAAKAESALLDALKQEKPVFLGGGMGYLPWFHFPVEYHFGGHAFVVCGCDGDQTLLASDMDQQMSGKKKGFYSPITLAQLRQARGSTFKPFPPKHLRLEFDFSGFRAPARAEILSGIAEAAEVHLDPPIKNFGVPGMRHTAKQILTWPRQFDADTLRANLFNLYVFIEIGGTGGGCFRSMYARFLEEGAEIAGLPDLREIAAAFHDSARRFTAIALLFQNALEGGLTSSDLIARISEASAQFLSIADLEEKAWKRLQTHANRT
jgi:hypothetical protein